MKRRLIRLAGASALFVVAAAATYQLTTVEGVDGLVLRMVLKEDTRFADQYSESAFREIRTGDSAQSVETALGKPLRIRHSDDGELVWHYSASPTDTHFRNRLVLFSEDGGTVTRTFAEFYVD